MLEETRKYMNHLGDYDVIVIGAGHAGIEAAHAAATLGARTAVFTMSLDAIGNMPCNPSIGGTAKGTLVRELDALGGVMGLAADATYLQSRMLNKGKGPAVHALRVQTDRKRYHEYMKHALELTPGLAIHQAEVVGIETENGRVKGVVTQLNGEYSAKCVVIATGTNLGGKIFVGDAWYASGPDGMHAANALTDSLKAAGLPLRRFKTGTPARVHRRSIDFSQLECQPGDPDSELQPFSFLTDAPMHNKVECWIAYTNPETHRIILDNIQRSPLYGGMIEGVGPRYCPSIEDKVVRFAGKDRHPIFVEPCGENTEEMYLQGASSSLPEDVQKYIAKEMDIPVSDVYGVATFYAQFNLEPKGQYTISVCMGTACYVKGSRKVLDKLEEVLGIKAGHTTPDGLFTLNATRCLGACGLAPVMMINEDVYGRLTPDEIPGIIAKYRS